MNARVLTKKGARVKNNKAAFILLKMYVIIKQGFGNKQNKKNQLNKLVSLDTIYKCTYFLRYQDVISS